MVPSLFWLYAMLVFMMFLLHCNSCFSVLFFLLCLDFFHFILHVCFLGGQAGIESGTAYLLTEDEAGG